MKDKLRQGETLFSEGEIEEAFAVFNTVLENQPDNQEALNNLGVIYHSQRNREKAEDYFLKVLAIKDDHPDALLNLINLYQEEQRWQEAAIKLEKYLVKYDQDTNLYNQLGVVYLEIGDIEKAHVVLAKSLELNPSQKIVKEFLKTLENEDDTPKSEFSKNSLNILFVQEAPCIRNYKMANALRSRGHKISLAYTKARLSQMYKGLRDDVYNECIQLTSYRHLWDITNNYDIIHCHNEPDILTVAALAGDAPVVHDTHDLISLRANGDPNLSYFEGVANRGSAGRVYTTPYQLEEAKRLYGVNGHVLVFYNYASESDLPTNYHAKLSDQDGQVHIVYEGGIGGNSHRDFHSLFVDLASQDIHIHIYPSFYSQEIAQYFSKHKNIHYNHPISPKQIIKEMTQYDFGIIPFNIERGNKRFLDSTIANKLFEYLAAGLPVITSPLKAYIDYFKHHPVGITFENDKDIIENIPKLKMIAKRTDFSRQIFTYENEITKLETFYCNIINDIINVPSDEKSMDYELKEKTYRLQSSENILDKKQEKNSIYYDRIYSGGGWQKQYHKHYSESYYYLGWKFVLSWLSNHPNPKILEIGCGNGQFAKMLFDNGITNYKGFDFSPIAVGLAKKNNEKYSGNFVVDNAYTSQLYNYDYNIVVILEVLEHIERDFLVLNKISKNTSIIFSVPNFNSESHVRWFNSKDDIEKRYNNIIKINKIKDIILSPTSNMIYLVKGIKR
jgi:2-polyprenyl-3-methyl-5-hydroxy-6-metoxy-1,4-benzoquinol methylase/glycosyltransferase involved in cell wall biosynthesis